MVYSTASINHQEVLTEVLGGEVDQVRIGHPDIENGHEVDEKEHFSWLNWADVVKSEKYDELHLRASLGDPRGCFVITIRRMSNGELIMHVPHEDESAAHMKLTKLHEGTYKIGH